MTVLYRSNLAELHLARAEDVLPGFATEAFELVVTDPPYGKEWVSNRRAESFDQLLGDGATERDEIRSVLAESVRLTRQNRHLYVFGPSDVLVGLKVSEPSELIWDKATNGSGDVNAPWSPAHEPISFVVTKHRHAGKAGCATIPARVRKGSVLRFPRPTGREVRHPSEKPIGLLRELIESSSRQGDTVLDPYAGVGSTGVAAILAGRKTVLVELDETFARIAVDRLKRAERIFEEARSC